MERHQFLALVPGFALASAGTTMGTAAAATTGTMVGPVKDITKDHLDVTVGRDIIRFAFGDAFTGVFSFDGKTPKTLADVKPGTQVRVAFIKPVLGEAYRKITEIDVLPGTSSPLPLPPDATH